MLSRLRRWTMVVALVVPLALGAAPPEDARSRARVLAKTAIDLGRAGSHAEALLLFEKAYALDPDPVLLYNIARVADAAGQLKKAADALGLLLVVEADPARREKAAQALEALRPRLPAMLTLRTGVAGALVEIDDQPVGRTPLAEPHPLTPGAHVLRVVAEGREPFQRNLEARASEALEVEVVLPARAAPLPPPPAAAPGPSRADRQRPPEGALGSPSDAELIDSVNETEVMNADLERILDAVSARLPSFLEVSCSRQGARVEVDGREVGRTPLEEPVRVKAGRHRLRVVPPTGAAFEVTVEVAAGETLAVDASALDSDR